MITVESKILLIDDSSVAREVIKRHLLELGYNKLDEADGGEDGFAKIKKAQKSGQPYDVIFVDWMMPDLQGIDVLKKCRADRDLKDIHLVMVTAEAERGSVIQAAHEGISAYVTKPMTKNDLDLVIKSLNKKRPKVSVG